MMRTVFLVVDEFLTFFVVVEIQKMYFIFI